jgi:hypothetical protein
MINCESAEKMSSNSANNRTSPAQKPSKNELKTRILNSILSRFSNNSSPTTTTTVAKKSSTTTTDNSIQKFSDKRIADLINPNNSKITQPPKPTVNYSINESRLREITHTPYPNQMFYPCNYGGNQLPLIKPVALRPKKFDTTYDSSTSSFSASPTVVSHSFRLSAQEQQWTYELNSNTQRNSRFINRRSTIARSEYSETPTVANQVQKPATVEAAKPLTQSQTQPQQQHYHSMMMRPRLNLIKMKIHNLIENKPAANFSMIQELKEKQIEHQRKFQIPNVNNNSSTTNNNTSTKFEMLLNNINNTANTNSNSNSATTNSNSNGSLISLTSSTSSLLSSSSTSSLTSAVYSGGDDDSNSLSFDKFGPNEPKIDLDLIENDNEL